MDDTTTKCISCDEEEAELYYCDTCEQSAEGFSDVQKELMCDSCISHHVKKGHDVRTTKGQVPVICADHKKLDNLYCKTCDVTFCPKCMGVHCTHELGNIDEKASEIKNEVFEILTKLELDEKPLRAKKSEISDTKEVSRNEQCTLSEVFETEIEALRQNCLKRIDQNLSLLDDEEKQIVDNVDRLMGLQKSSRDLLSMTSPRLIKEFKQFKQEYAEVCENCKTFASSFCVDSPEISDVKKMFAQFGKQIDKKLQINVMRTDERQRQSKRSLKKFVVGCSWANFISSVKVGKMKITRLRIPDGVSLKYEEVGAIEFNEEVESFFSVEDRNYLCSCIVFTHTSIFRIDLTKLNVCQKREMALPSFSCVICPYIRGRGDSKVNWCYWLEDRQVLKFSHDASFEIQCSAVPIWKSPDVFDFQLCFTTEKNEILIINLETNEYQFIPQTTHGVGSIDHLTLFGSWFFVWSLKGKSIIVMSKKNNQWNVVETQNWREMTQVISFRDQYLVNLRCVPALETCSSDDCSGYSFVTLSICY